MRQTGVLAILGTLVLAIPAAADKPLGDQILGLTNARINFHQDLAASTLANGDIAKLYGRISHVAKRCSTTGFMPVLTTEKVDIKPPLAARVLASISHIGRYG